MNDDALAKHIGVSHVFVNRIRNELLTVKSSPPEPVKRKGADGKSYPATYKKREPADAPTPKPDGQE
jgi:hypothetical protein